MVKLLSEEKDYLQNNIIEEEEKKIDSTPWIFFDYSGTLVDTITALVNTYTRFHKREFQPEEIKQLYKDYPKKGKLYIIFKYRINPFKYLFGKKKFHDIRMEEFMNHVRAYPGIPDFLNRLHKMNKVKMAIVTHETELENTEERNKIFQKFGLPDVFDAYITDEWKKEESFTSFVTENGIEYGVVIGDRQLDLDIGHNHDFDTIGVTWGFSKKEEFIAEDIVDDPRELLQAILEMLNKEEQMKLHGDPI